MEKSFDSLKLIGTLAVEKGWVSQEDVKFALEKQKTGKFFGEVLLSKQLITIEQLDELLKLQQESEHRPEDFLFGQIAVHNRFVKAQDVVDALESQKTNKFRESLGAILKNRGKLTEQQCVAILASQKRIGKITKSQNKKISCPKCKTFYNIKDPEKLRKVRCQNCKYIFEIGVQDVNIFVESLPIPSAIQESKQDIESKSLIEFLKENNLTPQSNLTDSTNFITKEDSRYVIGNEIARGGMGSILMTKDVNLRRNIVTKVLLNRKSKLATLRFIEEAQITGQLEHPNIPPVYDLGVNKEGNVFFTMKHIKGVTLESIIKNLQANDADTMHHYSYTVLTNIFIKVCNALEFAHSKKVIHRDIKPENIMIGEYGEVLLMDWGLAKIIGTKEEFEELNEERVSSVRSEDESSNTIEGTTAGTPSFMSPEQATGHMEELDHRADIYSLGASLYSVLALERPVKGKNVQEILKKAASGEIEDYKRPVPPELQAITFKAMEYNPKHRYQSIKEMEKDLVNYQLGYSVSAKQDSAWDIARKFYLRNKLLASISAIFVFVFLFGSIIFITSLRSQRNNAIALQKIAESALKQFEQEKLERTADNKNSAPTYFAKAQLEGQTNNFKEAEKLMDTAINYDSENQNYLLYRSCLAFTNGNLEKAKSDIAKIKNHPHQKHIDELYKVLNTPNLKSINEGHMTQISQLCSKMKLYDIAQKHSSDLNEKIKIWNKSLADQWGYIFNLAIYNDLLTFRISSQARLDLSALKGLPLQSIRITNSNISNFAFLENMPLVDVMLFGCSLATDLSSFRNLKLKSLHLEAVGATDLSPFANAELNTLILKNVNYTTLKPFAHQPIKELELYGAKSIDPNEFINFKLQKLTFNYSNITDLSFLNVQDLKHLTINGGRLSELNFLKNAPLEYLHLYQMPVKNISPLQNKKITFLSLAECRIEDLSPLLTLKNLETLVISPNQLQPNWENTIVKLKPTLKQIGVYNRQTNYKTVDAFIAEHKGFNINNPKK